MRLIRAGLVLAATLALGLAGSASAVQSDFHCPDGWAYKVEAPPALDEVVLDAGTEFCVKAATDNSGILVADGATPLGDYVTWLTAGEQTPTISYLAVYGSPDPSSSPEPSASPTLSPEPSASPTTTPTRTPTLTLPPTSIEGEPPAGSPEDGDIVAIMILFGAGLLGWWAFKRHVLGDRS
jgi:hypothetical protein